jgi:RND family efflux transporter MFP subunit
MFYLKRAKVEANSKIIQKENDIMRIKNNTQSKETDLKKTQDMLAKMQIIAPIDGVVSYSNVRNRYGMELKVGMQIWQAMTLLSIPYLSEYKVKLRIPEDDRSKIKIANKSSVKIKSIADLFFTGEIKSISTLATPINQWDPSSPKSFEVEVSINGSDERMQPGMSAIVEIVNEVLNDVLFIPVEAVYEKQGKNYCYVDINGQPIEKEIKIGKSNNDFIEIRNGLKENDKVYLYNPINKK